MCDKSRNTWLCVHWQWNTLEWCQLNALQASPVVHLVTPLSCVSLSMNTQPSVPTIDTLWLIRLLRRFKPTSSVSIFKGRNINNCIFCNGRGVKIISIHKFKTKYGRFPEKCAMFLSADFASAIFCEVGFISENIAAARVMHMEIHTISKHHYSDVVMSAMASEITGVPIVCSTVCSGADQRKTYQSSVSLHGLCEGTPPVIGGSPHKGPMFPFDDVIMLHVFLVQSGAFMTRSNIILHTTLQWLVQNKIQNAGARPTKHISIEFEIRWKFKTL